MKAATRLFGEIEIDESKIITFEDGIIGFPDMKKKRADHPFPGYSPWTSQR